MDVEPSPQESLPGGIDATVEHIQSTTQAVVSDHHLQKLAAYATFNGAEFVAACYDRGFPAILCTRWMDADRNEIRSYRRKIPVAIQPNKLDPDVLRRGYEVFIDERRGRYIAAREPHRTLLKVVDFIRPDEKDASVGVIVSGWDPETVVEIPLSWLPKPIRDEFLSGNKKYLRAEVNLGADQLHELFFDAWEPR